VPKPPESVPKPAGNTLYAGIVESRQHIATYIPFTTEGKE